MEFFLFYIYLVFNSHILSVFCNGNTTLLLKFDCQRNAFHLDDSGKTTAAANSASLDVDFSMVSKRSGREEISKNFHMREKVDFDGDTFVSSSGNLLRSHRSAHTEGRMFGL